MKNFVKEQVFDSLNECCRQRRASLYSKCGLSRQRNYVEGLQCNAYTVFNFTDTIDEGAASTNPPVFTCSFGVDADTKHLLAMGGEDGHLTIANATQNAVDPTIIPRNNQNIHQNAVMDISWVPGTKELLSAGGDKSVVLWKMAETRLQCTMQLLGHTRCVKTVKVNPYDPSVFASGGRDSNIVVWDRRCSPNQRADEITPAHPCLSSVSSSPRFRRGGGCQSPRIPPTLATPSNGVTSLLFGGQHSLVSAGSSDGLIKVWDLRKTHAFLKSAPQPLHTLHQPLSSTKMGFSWLTSPSYSNYVYALAMDNVIYAYHLGAPTKYPVGYFYGSLNSSYYVKASVSPCGRYLVSGSSDNKALVWLTGSHGNPVCQLTGHHGEVTAVDWGQDERGNDMVATCSDDFKHKIYTVRRSDPDDIELTNLSRGRAESIDSEVLERCNRLAKHFAPKRNTASIPVPKTPSGKFTNYATTPSGKFTNYATTPSGKFTNYATTPSGKLNNYATTPSGKLSRIGTPYHGQVLNTPVRGQNSSIDCMESPAGSGSNLLARSVAGTPSSVDKSLTLLHWLSSTKKSAALSNSAVKTPAPKTPNHNSGVLSSANTPKVTSGANNCHEFLLLSAHKRASIKRKLTEVLDEPSNGENSVNPCKKKVAVSPTKNILVDRNSVNGTDRKPTPKKLIPEESNLDESCKPFDTGLLDNLRKNSFMGSFTEMKKNNSINSLPDDILEDSNAFDSLLESPKSSNHDSNVLSKHMKSLFESPTANLPNFVKDGKSPHIRPVPFFNSKPTNWLKDLSKARKLKYEPLPEKQDANTSMKSTKPKKISKVSYNDNKPKKLLKIVPLADSPLTSVKSLKKNNSKTPKSDKKKTIQTRLSFAVANK